MKVKQRGVSEQGAPAWRKNKRGATDPRSIAKIGDLVPEPVVVTPIPEPVRPTAPDIVIDPAVDVPVVTPIPPEHRLPDVSHVPDLYNTDEPIVAPIMTHEPSILEVFDSVKLGEPPVEKTPLQPTEPVIADWERALQHYLETTKTNSTVSEDVRRYLATDGLYILVAMGLTESGGNKNAHGADGMYREWGREVESVGIFQIREPTTVMLRNSASYISPYRLPKGPTNPAISRSEMVKMLLQYPEQLLWGIILAHLGAKWANQDYSWSPQLPRKALSPTNYGSPAVVTAINDVVSTVNHPAVTPFALLLRLYWAASSRRGPAYLERNRLDDKVWFTPSHSADTAPPRAYINTLRTAYSRLRGDA